MTSPFDTYAYDRLYVAWRTEIRGEKPTKVPYGAARRHAKADDPATWLTRAEAEETAQQIVNGQGGGIGIMLGDLGADHHLAGLDLDSCIVEDGALADWAAAILDVVDTYAEVSPSGMGIKAFFYIESAYVRPFLDRIGVSADHWGCRRGIPGHDSKDHGPAVECYCDRRYFAITENRWPGALDTIRMLDTASLDRLANLIPKPGGGKRQTGGDTSRSAIAFRKVLEWRRAGTINIFEEMVEALRQDPETADWVCEKGEANNQRELRRIWEKAAPDAVRPIVQLVASKLPSAIDAAETILIESDPDLYEFADQVMRPAPAPIRIADNRTIIAMRLVPVKLYHMLERFSRVIEFQKYSKLEKKWLPADCPEAFGKTYLERVGRWHLPKLAALTACPMLLADGRIVDRPGFDPDSGILFDPQGTSFPPVPANPTFEDARLALADIKSLYAEFPFVDDTSRSVLLSALLTSVSRLAFDFVPLHGFDAPVAGTGKSKLVDSCSILVNGHECPVISQGDDETEFEKRLGAELLEGARFISIDNCEAPLGGALLCQITTQRLVKVRVLGLSKTVMIVNGALVFATGNNLRLYGDMLRRGLIGRLDAGEERPELRTFSQEDPVHVLKRDRGRYVVAALTVLRAFILAGRPGTAQPLGGFEGWSTLVRNALLWLGEADPILTLDIARAEDPDRLHLEAVIAWWWNVFATDAVTARQVEEKASSATTVGSGTTQDPQRLVYAHPDLRNALLDVVGERGGISTVRLGKWLGLNKHKVVGDRRIAAVSGRSGTLRWRLQQRDADGNWR